jgi:TRAP-type mannitol/chloroaromatic compound transport system permease small subunit
MNVLIAITKYIDKFQEILTIPTKWLLAIIMVLILFDVVMRYLFKSPTIWGLDVKSQLYAICIMIGTSYTVLVKGHVTVEAFTMKLSFRWQKIVDIINYILFYEPTMIILTWTMWSLTALAWRLYEGSGSPWNPPVYPLKTILTFSYFDICLQGVSEVLKDIVSLKKGSEDWIKER